MSSRTTSINQPHNACITLFYSAIVFDVSHFICSNALTVQLFLNMGRVDLAAKELEVMRKNDEDATVTQLASCLVDLATGGVRVAEALSAYEELQEKYGATALLLSGQGTCNLHLGRLPTAEKLFLEALEKVDCHTRCSK
jgi:hypothetical protein